MYGRLGAVQSLGLIVFLSMLLIVFSLASPYFLSVRNLANVLLAVSVIGVIASVDTLGLVARGLDLSTGSIVGLVGIVCADLLADRQSWWLSCLAALAVGGACGAVNGAIVVKLRINPIITTIGTLSVFRGVAYVTTAGQSVFVENPTIIAIASARMLGMPYAVILMGFLFITCGFVATRTRIGRTLYAIGANPRASLLAGLPIQRYRFWVFVASGLAAAVAGILLIGQSGTAVPTAGTGYELLVVTAVLLGGASLHGGEGKVSGTLLGVLIIGVLANGMTLLDVDSYYQTIANGALLLLAVAADQFRRSRDLTEGE